VAYFENSVRYKLAQHKNKYKIKYNNLYEGNRRDFFFLKIRMVAEESRSKVLKLSNRRIFQVNRQSKRVIQLFSYSVFFIFKKRGLFNIL